MPASKTAARASSSAFSRGSMRPTPPIPRSRSSWTIIRRMCRRKRKMACRSREGRFSFVFTPKHGSWLNLVGFFSSGALGLASHPGGFESRTQATDHGIPRRPQSPACCPRGPTKSTPSAIGSFHGNVMLSPDFSRRHFGARSELNCVRPLSRRCPGNPSGCASRRRSPRPGAIGGELPNMPLALGSPDAQPG